MGADDAKLKSVSFCCGPVQLAARAVLLADGGAAFLSSLDLFEVNVTFDAVGHDFGVGRPGGPTAGDLSWVLNAYAVAFASLVPFGRLAGRYGRRRLNRTALRRGAG